MEIFFMVHVSETFKCFTMLIQNALEYMFLIVFYQVSF